MQRRWFTTDEDEYLCTLRMNMVASTTLITSLWGLWGVSSWWLPVHGHLLTLDPYSDHDEASLQYTTTVFVLAKLTVKPSKIPNAGLGVFTTQFLPHGVRF